MLDPNLVDEWIHKCGWSDGTTRSSRWIFSQLGLAAKAGWSPQAETPRSRLAAPYSTRELKGVWETVASQHTARLRYVAAVIVTLGLATGADGRNVPHLTRGDISSDVHGTWVQLQAPERRVPVHPRWEVFISELRIGNPEDRLVGGRYTVNGELGAINQRRSYACPPIQLARLRSTYVVELIERRLPLQTLVAVTGLTTAGRLADFLPCCTKPTDDEIARDVRGER